MNRRRRFGAKARRRVARLKQMWMSGIPVDKFFHRALGRQPSVLDRFRTPPQLARVLLPRPGLRDLHQERADREGVPRNVAKARNFHEIYHGPGTDAPYGVEFAGRKA